MKKSFLLIISIVVVIALIGSSLGYVYMHNNTNTSNNNTNTKGTKSNPTLKILNFTSSLDSIESPEHNYLLPWNYSSTNFYIPFFNVSIYSQSSASIRIYMKSPNGTIMNLLSEPVIKYENITCPLGISTSILEYNFLTYPGSYTVTAELFQNSTIVMQNITEKVIPHVSLIGINGPKGMFSLGEKLNYTSMGAENGIAPYTYDWYIQYNGSENYNYWNQYELIKNCTNFSFTPAYTGVYNISLYVVDKLGFTSADSYIINVTSTPVTTIVPLYPQVDAGVVDNFTAIIQGGLSPYYYNWSIYFNNKLVYDSPIHNISYNFKSPGIYEINLIVKDTIGGTSYSSYNLTVNPIPSFNITMSNIPIDLGMADNILINIYNGTIFENINSSDFYDFAYEIYINGSLFDNGKLYERLNSITIYPENSGIQNITIMVYDPFHEGIESFIQTINPDLSSNITINPTNNLTVGEVVNLKCVFSGGTAPYNFTWTIDYNLTSVTLYGQAVEFEIPSSGYYSITLVVTDTYAKTFLEGTNYDYYYFSVS